MVRFIIAAVAALTVALSLFLLMNTLISGEQRFDRSALGGQVVDFIRVRPDEIPETRERAPPEEPPPPEDPPPPKQINVVDESRPMPIPLNIELPNITVPASIAGGPNIDSWLPQGATTDGDVMPIVRIDPQWPREALLDRIERLRGLGADRIGVAEAVDLWAELAATVGLNGRAPVSPVTMVRYRSLADRHLRPALGTATLAEVDTRFVALGIPLWLEARVPGAGPGLSDRSLRRLLVAQDTGSAIKGPLRGDVFWGSGAAAEWLAGQMKAPGRSYLLLPAAVARRLEAGRIFWMEEPLDRGDYAGHAALRQETSIPRWIR